MRTFLRKVFAAIPSDVFSFIGGAVFSVFVDLARESARAALPSSGALLKIAAAFFVAMVCLVLISHHLRTAQEVPTADVSRDERLSGIGDRLKSLCLLLAIATISLILGFYLIFAAGRGSG